MHDHDSKYPLCRHIKANGLRCESPALRGETFCYFHQSVHTNHPAALTARQIISSWKEGVEDGIRRGGEDPYAIASLYPHQNEYNFPPLEDAESVQLAASILFHAVAQGQIHPLRARVLLRALTVVNHSLTARKRAPEPDLGTVVRAIERAPNGVTIAAQDPPDTASDASAPVSQPQSIDEFANNSNK